MKSCATCSRWPCLGRGIGLDDPQRSLPTPKILWLCEPHCCSTRGQRFAPLLWAFLLPICNAATTTPILFYKAPLKRAIPVHIAVSSLYRPPTHPCRQSAPSFFWGHWHCPHCHLLPGFTPQPAQGAAPSPLPLPQPPPMPSHQPNSTSTPCRVLLWTGTSFLKKINQLVIKAWSVLSSCF